MFRNQYDSSTTTWSPQGRIHQIEYAMEAVKQGSATVGRVVKLRIRAYPGKWKFRANLRSQNLKQKWKFWKFH